MTKIIGNIIRRTNADNTKRRKGVASTRLTDRVGRPQENMAPQTRGSENCALGVSTRFGCYVDGWTSTGA
eukprot:5494671-Pleurochrysis_carterae.AAC.1